MPLSLTCSDNKNNIDKDCSLAKVRESVEHIAAHFWRLKEFQLSPFMVKLKRLLNTLKCLPFIVEYTRMFTIHLTTQVWDLGFVTDTPSWLAD